MKNKYEKIFAPDDPEVRKKMHQVDKSFLELLEGLDKLKLHKDAILIQGIFILLEYNYKVEDRDNLDVSEVLKTYIEAFKIFLTMRACPDDYIMPPSHIISHDEMKNIFIYDSLSQRGIGAVECYSLLQAISEHISIYNGLKRTGGHYYNNSSATKQ